MRSLSLFVCECMCVSVCLSVSVCIFNLRNLCRNRRRLTPTTLYHTYTTYVLYAKYTRTHIHTSILIHQFNFSVSIHLIRMSIYEYITMKYSILTHKSCCYVAYRTQLTQNTYFIHLCYLIYSIRIALKRAFMHTSHHKFMNKHKIYSPCYKCTKSTGIWNSSLSNYIIIIARFHNQLLLSLTTLVRKSWLYRYLAAYFQLYQTMTSCGESKAHFRSKSSEYFLAELFLKWLKIPSHLSFIWVFYPLHFLTIHLFMVNRFQYFIAYFMDKTHSWIKFHALGSKQNRMQTHTHVESVKI